MDGWHDRHGGRNSNTGADVVDDVRNRNRKQYVVSIGPLFVPGLFVLEWARCNEKKTCVPRYGGKTTFYRELTGGRGDGFDINESRWI